MALSALRGAVGFLTRIPVGHDERAWTAFSASPVAAVPVGYLVGACLALPFVAGASAPVAVPATVVAFAYLVATYGLTGITHLDGVADCGDAVVVHGDTERRREVLKDTTTGVGAVAAVALVVVALALAAVAVAGLAVGEAVAVVVASEVGAKAAMATLAAVADPPHDGLGSALADGSGVVGVVFALVLALPVVALGWWARGDVSGLLAAVTPVVTGVLVAAVAVSWARSRLGGVSGDVFGATNELARLVGLHVGVIAWTLS
ncbi:adenosylcobinamide-GDP ribazoletransferase [Haloarchaeobius sp. FL176]|uniref:adenosylcobinamide-GDP ribazoletransferase n=1 Tax=Haloarchaeobius sp. FL176 TaxID=2967129 RepID=UPI0021472C69